MSDSGIHHTTEPSTERTRRRSVIAAVTVFGVLGVTVGGALLHAAGVQSGRAQMREQAALTIAQQSADIADAAGKTAVERSRRARAGVVELDQLPEGVDRAAATQAEGTQKAFAYTENNGCSVVLRLPSGVVIDLYPRVDETGGAVSVGPSLSGCTFRESSGARPPVSERASRWESAIVAAKAYEYGDGGRAVHVDVSRCTGFVVPLPPTAAGAAVDPVTPTAGPNSAESCKGVAPGSAY